jgi:hypothetical protein
MAVTSKSRALNIYRKLLCGVTLLALAAGAAAQTAAPKQKRSARAVALIEWHKDPKGALAPRLVPISFLWEGKYYDAGLYEASPRPMALEPGTVYEGMRSGVPAGLYTVRGAFQLHDVWYGDGIWSPGATGLVRVNSDDERPRLSRAAEPSTSAPPPLPETHSGSATQPEAQVNDPNRPTLTRGPARAPAPPSPSPTAAPKGATSSPAPPKPQSAAQPNSNDKPESLVAISDEQAGDTRPYLFPWNREEEERLTGEMKTLAEAEVTRQAKGAKPELDQVHVRAFDLNTDNLAEIVLSARATVTKAPIKGRKPVTATWYVTVVARTTVSGELRRLFASVTSSAWLGSVPRMELVDAVDADGDNYGELLFALVGDTGRGSAYAIYRVGRDELFKLVETGLIPND